MKWKINDMMTEQRGLNYKSNLGPPRFTKAPTIFGNPNPRVPLAGILSFSSDKDVQTTIEISDGEHQWKINFDNSHNPQDGLPILGMCADRRHKFQVSIQDSVGNVTHASETLEFKTPPLPYRLREFPPIRVTVSKPGQMEPGVTLMNVRRRIPGRVSLFSDVQRKFFTCWSMIVALNTEGEVIWYYISDARLAGFDRLQNGNLFYLNTNSQAIEIDMLGNKVGEWYAARRPAGPVEGAIPVDAQTMHHQPHELPWGNFITHSAFSKEIKNFYTSVTDPEAPRRDTFVMGDEIVEFRRDGSVAWRWNSFEHLDPYRIGFETLNYYWHVRGFHEHADWTHGNGICYDEQDDAILICLRLQDAVIKVDRSTGEICWILGDHHGWPDWLKDKLLKPEGKLRWPFRMHNPKITPGGTILVWDNGTIQARPFDGRPQVPPHQVYSRAVEYKVDEKQMTVKEVWSSLNVPGIDRLISQAMGDVRWMPQTGNVLAFCGACGADRDDMSWDHKHIRHISEFPCTSRVREFTHSNNSELVFEAILADPDEVLSWECFCGLRVPSLYPSE